MNAIPAAKAKVRRVLIGRREVGIISDAVSHTADRLERVATEGSIDLGSQIANVDIHDVRVALEGEVPDVLDQGRAADHLVLVAHEVFEQSELLRGDVKQPI